MLSLACVVDVRGWGIGRRGKGAHDEMDTARFAAGAQHRPCLGACVHDLHSQQHPRQHLPSHVDHDAHSRCVPVISITPGLISAPSVGSCSACVLRVWQKSTSRLPVCSSPATLPNWQIVTVVLRAYTAYDSTIEVTFLGCAGVCASSVGEKQAESVIMERGLDISTKQDNFASSPGSPWMYPVASSPGQQPGGSSMGQHQVQRGM